MDSIPEGLEALIFTAEGDMRQVVNNLQSTVSGFNFVSPENVFKVCDQPHPVLCQEIIQSCMISDIDKAVTQLVQLWNQGFSAVDIIATLFKVTKTFDMPEYLKLEFIKVKININIINVIGDWYDAYEDFGRIDYNCTIIWINRKIIKNEHEPFTF